MSSILKAIEDKNYSQSIMAGPVCEISNQFLWKLIRLTSLIKLFNYI